MIWLKELFDLFGSLICHQLPDRTLSANGILLPVCARDMGIYAGIFVSALYLLARGRWKAQKPPGIAASIIMCLLMVPMILDGGLSYIGVTESNNISRVITGALFGVPIPAFFIPAAHFNVNETSGRMVLKKWTELFSVYGLSLILSGLLLKGFVPYPAAALIFIGGLGFLLTRISYTLLKRSRRFEGLKLYTITAITTIGVAGLLYLVSSLILQPLKAILLKGAA
jgi:uncharacterized membrane protein